MKYSVAILFCIVAAVSASGYTDKAENLARERKVNSINGYRQARVNNIAEASGASSGTYQVDGVPGTGVGNKRYGYPTYSAGYPAGYSGYNGYSGYGGNRAGHNAYPAGYSGNRAGYSSYPAGYSGNRAGYSSYPAGYSGSRAGYNNYPAGYSGYGAGHNSYPARY